MIVSRYTDTPARLEQSLRQVTLGTSTIPLTTRSRCGQPLLFRPLPWRRQIDRTDRSVYGEVHRLKDPQFLLPSLDEYEGSGFERAMTLTHVLEQTMDGWIYRYVGSVTGRLIASGDWLNR